MSNQYHYVIVFDEDDGGWRVDVDGEESAFPNGTIYNNDTREWEFGYAGDGNFVGIEQELSEQLSQTLDNWNFKLKTGE